MAKILLVEDEDVQRKAMEAILRFGGHEVLLAGNGAQALVVARDKLPDVLISDIAMPKMSGTELCQKVRESPGLDATYCILATAREGESVKLESLLSGADDFLHKPVSKDDLLGRVQIGLRIRKLRQMNVESSNRAEILERNQSALVAALDVVMQGLGDAVNLLGAEDARGAMGRLRRTHEEVRIALASVVLPDHPPAPEGASPSAGGTA